MKVSGSVSYSKKHDKKKFNYEKKKFVPKVHPHSKTISRVV